MIEDRTLDMDLTKTIEDLRREKEKLEQVIASLEELQATGQIPVRERRRGRRSMSPEERREVSARMKKYWANRLASSFSAGLQWQDQLLRGNPVQASLNAAGSGSAEFVRTIGAHTVGKVCFRMVLYIRFELLPVTLIVTDSFAPSTDWDETS